MNNSNIILQGITIDEFLDLLSDRIIERIESKYQIKSEKELLSIDECAKKRGVSVQTIRNWMKDKNLKRYRMGKRVFLDYSEIMDRLGKL